VSREKKAKKNIENRRREGVLEGVLSGLGKKVGNFTRVGKRGKSRKGGVRSLHQVRDPLETRSEGPRRGKEGRLTTGPSRGSRRGLDCIGQL